MKYTIEFVIGVFAIAAIFGVSVGMTHGKENEVTFPIQILLYASFYFAIGFLAGRKSK